MFVPGAEAGTSTIVHVLPSQWIALCLTRSPFGCFIEKIPTAQTSVSFRAKTSYNHEGPSPAISISSQTKSCEVLSGACGPGATGLLFLQDMNMREQETKISNAIALKMKASFHV